MWCEHPACGKQDLSKDDVIYDQVHRLVVCRQCFGRQHPQWSPPVEVIDYTKPQVAPMPAVQYEVSFNNREGLKARISYGEMSFGVHAPMEMLARWLTR